MDAPRSRLAADGTRVFYRLWRPAAPVGALVLLHGVASNSTRWWEFVAGTRLRERWCLVRVDRRGQGESVARRGAGMAEWCEDIAAILADEGFERGVVAGHCLGANIAVEFAARYPQRTSGIVLVEPMLRPALAGVMRTAARLRPLVQVLAATARAANALGLHRRHLPSLDLEVLDREARAAMAAGNTQALDRYASPLADLAIMPIASYLQDLLAVTAPLPALETIRAPALVLMSRHSTFTDPAATKRELARIPDCSIAEIEAQHWIPTEQPLAMREAIDAWIARRFMPSSRP